MKIALVAVLCALPILAQPTQTVAVSKGTPNQAFSTFIYLDGSSNPQYICKAFAAQPSFTFAVTPLSNQGTLTSIVVSSNTGTVTTSAHGFDNPRSVGAVVTVAGSTTAALNGSYIIQSVTNTTVFTITTSGVSDGTYSTAALTLSSTAPRTTSAVWSIERYAYSSGTIIADQFAAPVVSGGGGSTANNFICANRTTVGYH